MIISATVDGKLPIWKEETPEEVKKRVRREKTLFKKAENARLWKEECFDKLYNCIAGLGFGKYMPVTKHHFTSTLFPLPYVSNSNPGGRRMTIPSITQAINEKIEDCQTRASAGDLRTFIRCFLQKGLATSSPIRWEDNAMVRSHLFEGSDINRGFAKVWMSEVAYALYPRFYDVVRFFPDDYLCGQEGSYNGPTIHIFKNISRVLRENGVIVDGFVSTASRCTPRCPGFCDLFSQWPNIDNALGWTPNWTGSSGQRFYIHEPNQYYRTLRRLLKVAYEEGYDHLLPSPRGGYLNNFTAYQIERNNMEEIN